MNTLDRWKHLTHSTLIMSIGWITQVASIPEAPPLTKGFTAVQIPIGATFFSSAISSLSCWESYGTLERSETKRFRRERDSVGGGGERNEEVKRKHKCVLYIKLN